MDIAGGWRKRGQVLAGLGKWPPYERGGLRLGTVRSLDPAEASVPDVSVLGLSGQEGKPS